MQLHPLRQVRFQFIPDTHDQVLDGAHLAPHEIHIQIEIAVIEFLNDVFVDEFAEFLGVEDEAGIRIGHTLDGHIQFKIVTMPVCIGAFSKNFLIFFNRPVGIEQFMGCIEMFDSGQVYHAVHVERAKVGNKHMPDRQGFLLLCSMQILLVSATPAEIKPLLTLLKKEGYPPPFRHELDILITGVGLVASTFSIVKQLHIKRPDLVIQAGVAGSFDSSLPLGSVVAVASEVIADQGVREKGPFRDLFDLQLARPNAFPYKKGRLVNPHTTLLRRSGLKTVHGISVNSITSSAAAARVLKDRYQAGVESMEGAALHYACLMEQVPFLQIRSLSNRVGVRDKKKWELAASIQSLHEQLIRLLGNL